MKTYELIDQLVMRSGPVRTLKSPSYRLMLWLFCSFAWMSGLILFFGLRPDINDKLAEASFWFESFPVLLMAILSGYISLALGVPGTSSPSHLKKLGIGLGVGWIFAFIAGIPSRTSHAEFIWSAGPGGLCLESIFELGIPPAILLFLMIKKTAPTFPGWNGAMALFATGSLAAWGTQWICSYEFPLHFLVWHLIPAWLIGLAGFWLGSKFLRWLPKKA